MKMFSMTVTVCLVATAVGCVAPDESESELASDAAALLTENGLPSINGLSSFNGLSSVNGLSSFNGLITADGLATMSYIIRCALPAGHTITMKDLNGKAMPLTGQIGLAPEWETASCSVACQEKVSACLLAHVNTSGQHISLWLDGPDPALGWGRSTDHPYQEGSFFGNIFLKTPVANYCNGRDFDYGVVPGRLGATQAGAPYTDPNGPMAMCTSLCKAAGGSANNDGFSVCYGTGGLQYTHIVTVYRNFQSGTPYKLCDRQSGFCLAATDTTAGSQVVRAAYASTNAYQMWTITQTAAGIYKVINVGSGRALDMLDGKIAVGTALVQAAYTGSATQQFKFNSVADGTGFFRIQPSTTTLDALGNPGTNKIQLDSWSWTDDQKWAVALAQ